MSFHRDLGNAGALLVALLLSAAGGLVAWSAGNSGPGPLADSSASPDPHAGPNTSALVTGSDGVAVPSGDYRRIISIDPAIDDAVVALGLLPRLLAVSDWSRLHGASSTQLQSVVGHAPAGVGVETLAAFTPDLVLISASSDPARTAQARASGLRLFACSGDGSAADVANATRLLGRIVGQDAQGEAVAARFLRRMAHAADPRLPRLGACYCATFGGKLYGGTSGTSFHDLLLDAGFDDVPAAHGWRGWPEYRLEDLIALAPAVLVTSSGGRGQLTAWPGSQQVPAIANGRIIELDEDLLARSGLGLLETTEALAEAREHLP